MSGPVFLEIEEVVRLHAIQLRLYGGRGGVRDSNMLESAVEMPRAGFGGEYLHADMSEMAAAYAFHIVMNHPFVDGNKRTGFHAALVFLDLNGYEFAIEPTSAYDLIIGVCEGTITKGALAEAFREHCVPLESE